MYLKRGLMKRTVKKNLVTFIVFAMCISLLFSVKPLVVNANGKANIAISGPDEYKWVKLDKGLTNTHIYSLAIDPKNTQTRQIDLNSPSNYNKQQDNGSLKVHIRVNGCNSRMGRHNKDSNNYYEEWRLRGGTPYGLTIQTDR